MKTGKKWSPQGGLGSPYKRAAQEWDMRIGDAVIHAKNWRFATFSILLFVALPSVCGMIYLGSLPKMVPHIVEVAQDGGAAYLGPVGKQWARYKPSDPSIKYHLHRFIQDTRLISSDAGVIKENWLDAFKLVSPRAANTLSSYVQKNDPFIRAAKERVSIDFLSMVRISENSWQVDWKESQWGTMGDPLGETYWRGIFRVVLNPPASEKELAENPIGLYVDEYNISQLVR
ncbi:MAG: type IV secretion system protein [Chlorobiaceae bacterium]|nr:type IV secretion system protein [Chlorobiaceae bacterium]NTV61773.1 type IV secretion system protein [Chlorobiaceae bacterium]